MVEVAVAIAVIVTHENCIAEKLGQYDCDAIMDRPQNHLYCNCNVVDHNLKPYMTHNCKVLRLLLWILMVITFTYINLKGCYLSQGKTSRNHPKLFPSVWCYVLWNTWVVWYIKVGHGTSWFHPWHIFSL